MKPTLPDVTRMTPPLRAPKRPAGYGGTAARIVFVIDEYETSAAGTERQLLELITGLDRSRYEPHLAVFRPSAFLADCSTFPCPVHVLNVRSLSTPTALLSLAGLSRLVARLEAPIAHTFFNDASIAAPLFCRLGGARTVAARRDMGFWYTPAKLRALRISNRFVDVIAANSEAVKRNVHAREGFVLDRIAVVPNGHDPRRFDVEPAAGLRQRLGIREGEKVVGMVANLYPRKRQADVIRALPAIISHSGPVHLILAGDGPDGDELMSLAIALGVGRVVHILRGTNDVAPIVKHFDVAVLASESEGSSNAIIEYAFCKRPIVCTNVGGNPELIKHRESGLHVECGDVAGVASAVSELLAAPRLAERLAANAHQLAASRYTSRAMLAAYMHLYDTITSTQTIPVSN